MISVGTIVGTLCTNAFQRSYQRSPSWKYCTVWRVGNISSTGIFRYWRKVYTGEGLYFPVPGFFWYWRKVYTGGRGGTWGGGTFSSTGIFSVLEKSVPPPSIGERIVIEGGGVHPPVPGFFFLLKNSQKIFFWSCFSKKNLCRF